MEPPGETRELTVDEAVALGIVLQKNERLDEAQALSARILEFHGRYAHRRPYVERTLAAAGLVPETAEADLRLESGMPVAGLVIRAKKGNARSA